VENIYVRRENIMFEFSDAWFLTTLILNKGWASKEEIIRGADIINHSIMLQSEMDNAIQKFLSFGYIEMDNGKYRATEKAHELANCTAFKRAGLFTTVDVILKRLNRKPKNARNE
jgi:hypothetical protein